MDKQHTEKLITAADTSDIKPYKDIAEPDRASNISNRKDALGEFMKMKYLLQTLVNSVNSDARLGMQTTYKKDMPSSMNISIDLMLVKKNGNGELSNTQEQLRKTMTATLESAGTPVVEAIKTSENGDLYMEVSALRIKDSFCSKKMTNAIKHHRDNKELAI